MSSTLARLTDSSIPFDQSMESAETHHEEKLHEQETWIGPSKGFSLRDLVKLWQYRELLYYLAWRDVAIRFKQSILGVAWALIQPLATMIVFAGFLGRLGGLNTGIQHYSLFVLAGVLPWTFFANAVTAAGNSILGNERLITKIYFPRLLVPLASIGAPFFDFLISLALLAVLMLWYRVAPGWGVMLVPILVFILFLAAAGVGLFLSALIVAQRDFKFVLNFGIQMWMFATPCIYLSDTTFGPLAHRWLPLNPAYGLILNIRQCLLNGPLDWYSLLISTVVSLAVLVAGLFYFRRIERSFADLI
ncbi:MAG: ABC transporter permease [Gemmatales bacterium]